MGDPAVSEEVDQRGGGRGKHSKQLKPPHVSSKTSRQAAKNVDCLNSAQPSSAEQHRLSVPAVVHTKERRRSLCSSDSFAGDAAAGRVRGAPRVYAEGVATDTLSYFTLAESENGSSFYFLGTCEAEDDIASGPSVFFWNPSEACVHEVDAGLGTCRRIHRLPAEERFVAGVGGCCCVSAAAPADQPRRSRHREKTMKRKKREQALHQEVSIQNLETHTSPSAALSQQESKRNGDKVRVSLPAEETQCRLLFILAVDCGLRQLSSALSPVPSEAKTQKEEENKDKGGRDGERAEGRDRNGSMERILQEQNSLSLGGSIYAVYALPSSPARGTSRGVSPSLCLVVHAAPLSRKEQQQQDYQQQKKEQKGDMLQQGKENQQQTHAAASIVQQQQQRPDELHFAVVCCSSLKVLSTCTLPFGMPLSSTAAAAEAAAEIGCTSEVVTPEEEKCRQAEARNEPAGVDRQQIEKVYLTGSLVHKPQRHEDVIGLHVVVHMTTAGTGEALLHSSKGGKAPREIQGGSGLMRGDGCMQVDVCMQALLEVTVKKQQQRENARLRSATGDSEPAADAAACGAGDAIAHVAITCRSSFCRLGEEYVYTECRTDREAASTSCGDSKRRRVSDGNSNCNSSSSKNDSSSPGRGDRSHSTVSNSSDRSRERRFVSCFPNWAPPTSAPAATVDGSFPSPLVMLSHRHSGEFQLFSAETSTTQLLLSKRFRSLLFPERYCHMRGAALLSTRCFVEWIRGDETETGCLLLLRELMWGAPCSPVYRLDCSRYISEPPVLLRGDRPAAAATAVDLLWRGNAAVFATPLLRPVVSHRRLLGACAGFPLTAAPAAGYGSNAAAVIRRKVKEDHALLLRAAGVGNEGRAADVAAALLSLTSARDQLLQPSQLPFDEAWTSSEEERRKTEKAICSALKEGVVPIPSALVSYIIEHAMEQAAVQCCHSPLIQEASVVQFLLWRPARFLPLVLGGQLSFSKSLLLQSLRQVLARGNSGAGAAVLEMLQLLSAWLKHYCSLEAQLQVEQKGKVSEDASSTVATRASKRGLCTETAPATGGKDPEPQQQGIPPLHIVLDFIAILVGARLPEIIVGVSLFNDEASSREMQEKKLLLKVLKRVQQLLEAADGKALRRVEGGIFAALSAQTRSAEDGGAESERVEAFKVAL